MKNSYDDGFRANFFGDESREPLRPKEKPYFQEHTADSGAPLILRQVAADYGYEIVNLANAPIDPYVLYDRFGHIAYQWPNDYEPDFTDVINICQKLTK